MSDISQQQIQQALLQLLGGTAQKSAQERKLYHPELGWQVQQKAVSSASSIWGHGPGGLFSNPALERPIFSALLLPRLGLLNLMPVRGSNFTNPLYGIFTGVTATTGSDPVGACDDPPTAGLSKLCMHQFVFGKQALQTRAFDVRDAGRLANRGEHYDLQFDGNPFQPGTQDTSPTIPGGITLDQVLNNERVKAAFELAVGWSINFAKEVYTGNPVSNTDGRQYFYGLDLLINTGYRDAVSGIACPAADSIVQSFGNQDFTASSGGSYGIVRRIASIYHQLRYIAQNAGLMPVQWVLAMPPTMFYELVQVWPLQYNTLQNQTITNGTTNVLYVDGTEMARQRNDMLGDWEARTGQFLMVDNIRLPVVLDDGIAVTEIAGQTFRGSIYFVPMTVMGGTPSTMLEYYNYDSSPVGSSMEFANQFAPGYFRSSDNGRFMWAYKPPNNWCVQYLVSSEPRVLLLTPMLAARLTNVAWTPLAMTRSPYNNDGGSFYVNGGSTQQPQSSYFTPTA